MIRTQIYLTEEEKAQLEIIALTRGVKQSELIREAVDELIEKYTPSQRLTRIKQARGLWKIERTFPPYATFAQDGAEGLKREQTLPDRFGCLDRLSQRFRPSLRFDGNAYRQDRPLCHHDC